MTQTDSRARLLVGSLLLIVGAGLLVVSSRVLATFLLDVVVQTLQPGEGPEPYDFSWGTMHWGRAAADFTLLSAGCVILGVGHLFVLPPVVHRLKSAAGGSRTTLLKLALASASVLMLLAAGSFLLIPLITKQAFGALSVAGAADPVSLAEDLPVLSSSIFMVCLVAAQFLIVLAASSVPEPGPVETSAVGKVASAASSACLLLFALLITLIRMGPVSAFDMISKGGGQADPAALAVEITHAVNLMFAGGPLLALAAILTGVAVFSPAKSVV